MSNGKNIKMDFPKKFMVKKQNNRKDDKDKIENESQSK